MSFEFWREDWSEFEKAQRELEESFGRIDRAEDLEINKMFSRLQAETDLGSEWYQRQPNPYGQTHYFIHLENDMRFDHENPVPDSGMRSERAEAYNRIFTGMEFTAQLHNSKIDCAFSLTGPLLCNLQVYHGRRREEYDELDLYGEDHGKICVKCRKLVESITGQKFWRAPE